MKLEDFNMTKEEMIATCDKYMNEQFRRYDFIANSGRVCISMMRMEKHILILWVV